ncbi:hypothetical protein QUF55_00620 [Clostridiaceae bacterium HSG29]|nr:hypothetical protein [Clostridiaceae bacterium HSG29]
MKKKAFLFMIVLVLLIVACDHTKLDGEILIVESNIVDDSIVPLKLEVSDELSEIYQVMWTTIKVNEEDEMIIHDLIVRDKDLLNYYSEDELKQIFNVEALNYDRIALFIPISNGKYIIEVDGFYKQTNPQPITRKEVIIK